MPDFDETQYEERLRHALRHVSTPSADPDAVLARVEHGVRRRVRRRRIGTATLGVAAVMTAAAVVVPSLSDDSRVADGPRKPPGHEASKRLHSLEKSGSATAGVQPHKRTDTPKKSALTAGNVTKASDIAVSDIAVNPSGDVGVIGESNCPGGPCIVAGSPADNADFRVAPSKDNLLRPMKMTVSKTVGGENPGIELGSDSSNLWAWTDAFYATHDAGKTWKPVALPHALRVKNVQANNGRVWAFGVRANGRAGVASADEHGENWASEPVPVGAHETIETPMVVGDRVAFVASGRDGYRSAFVRRSSTGWTRTRVMCPTPVASTSADSTVWLGCRTPSSPVVIWSRDGGKHWESTLISRRGPSAVGGVNATTAIVGVGAEMMTVNATNGAVEPVLAPPFIASDDVWDGKVAYTSIRFDDNGTGWATTTGGALGRSDDGGRTWHPASLP